MNKLDLSEYLTQSKKTLSPRANTREKKELMLARHCWRSRGTR